MIRVVALSPVKRPNERRPRVATYYGYDVSGNLEMMTKTMTDTTLHRTADEPVVPTVPATTGIVAPRLALSQRGLKTMMMAMPGRIAEDKVACKPS
jgi:hypothetical protein